MPVQRKGQNTLLVQLCFIRSVEIVAFTSIAFKILMIIILVVIVVVVVVVVFVVVVMVYYGLDFKTEK